MTTTLEARPMQTAARSPYDRAFFEHQTCTSSLAAQIVVPLVDALVGAASVVDVGCGVGAWLAAFQAHGAGRILGFDGSYVDRQTLLIDPKNFRSHDLAQPLHCGERFDLALSLEVAEHLPAAAAESHVQSLTDLAPVVLFSAAPPYQGGVNHVNEQWLCYWSELFGRRGYQLLDPIRPLIWNDQRVPFWYRQNIVLFAAEDFLLSGRLPGWERYCASDPMLVITASIFQEFLARELGLWGSLKRLPRLLARAVRNRIGGFETTMKPPRSNA